MQRTAVTGSSATTRLLSAMPAVPSVPLLHKTKHYVLINKPPGVYSQGPKTPDVIGLLQRLHPSWFDSTQFLHPFCEPKLVQRLDSSVSGAMVLGTSMTYVTKMARYLSHRGNNGIPIDKRYIALLDITKSPILQQIQSATTTSTTTPPPAATGITWTTNTSGTINADLLMKDPDSNSDHAPIKRVEAITKFWLYPQYPSLPAQSIIVVFEPVTGRKHQLRRHAAQVLNAPIKGDSLYNGTNNNRRPNQIALHSLEFGISTNPMTTLTFRAPVLWGTQPEDNLWHGVVDKEGFFHDSVYQLKSRGGGDTPKKKKTKQRIKPKKEEEEKTLV